MTDFGEELRTRTGLVIPAGCEIDPSAYYIAGKALEDIDHDYGEDSDNPLEHHNAWHGLDHVVRDMVLINPVIEYIPGEYREDIRELGVVNGSLHDRYQHLKKFGLNEIFSAAYGLNLISDYGSDRINNERFRFRSAGGVVSTTTFIKPDGSIVQPKLLEGEADPHKFFMVASDVYAPIAIGGVSQMLVICRNLTLEQFKNPTPIQGYNFVAGEVQFLREGLNPDRIKEVIAHFFPKTGGKVYDTYHDYFNRNIVEASRFAKAVNERTDKAEEIGEALLAGAFDDIGELVGMRVKMPDKI